MPRDGKRIWICENCTQIQTSCDNRLTAAVVTSLPCFSVIAETPTYRYAPSLPVPCRHRGIKPGILRPLLEFQARMP
jgi:hypothetical protein